MKKILLLFLGITLFTSCSNELDRGDAEDMIKDSFTFPYVEMQKLPEYTNSKNLNNKFQNLRADDLMTHRQKGRYGDNFTLVITPKGRLYTTEKKKYNYGYTVATNLVDFKEITGIRFNDAKTSATVDYVLERKNITPFGNSLEKIVGETIEKKANFSLYDDGWRIQKANDNNYTLEDFPGLNNQLEIPADKLAELEFYGKWKSINKSFGSYSYIEVSYSKEDGISAYGYQENEQEFGMGASNGEIENNRLIFKGDDHFSGMDLTISNSIMTDNVGADKTKYKKVK